MGIFRKRSLIFRAIILIPAIWFLVVLILAYYDRIKLGRSEREDSFLMFRGGQPGGIFQKTSKHDNLVDTLHRPEKSDKPDSVIHKLPDGPAPQEVAQRHMDPSGPRGPVSDSADNINKGNVLHPPLAPEPNIKHIEEIVKESGIDGEEKELHGKQQVYKIIPRDEPYDPNAPGEMGKAVKLDNLNAEEKQKVEDGQKKNAFNQYASDMISLHRHLPDVRDATCSGQKYLPISQLPDTSVIICFHNEAWSTLLRTVHSVLDHSPKELIKEIVLVDDFSDMDHLQKPLEEYMAALGKVRIVRAKRREGLIRARLLGAAHAKGTTLTYLDSHCECCEGWLIPLLDRIARNSSTVVCPVIDVIDDNTLEYHYGRAAAISVGGFDWNLQFNWHAIPAPERKRRKSEVDPLRSPTMAGGLFSIDRAWFERLGTYDPGFDIWGGENLELSFKTWMCGGSLEIIPCSHVGHIFRKRSPYKWRTGSNVLKKNSVRLAEVWLDEYKSYYFERINKDLGDYGDVSARKQLRKDLQCKTFDWFLKNVYPEQFIPGDAVASGEVRNKGDGSQWCLDSAANRHAFHKPVSMYRCHRQGGNQFWQLSKDGEIRRDDACLDFAGKDVIIYPCHGQKGNQLWKYDPSKNNIRHESSSKCMEMKTDHEHVSMEACDETNERQLWVFENYKPEKL